MTILNRISAFRNAAVVAATLFSGVCIAQDSQREREDTPALPTVEVAGTQPLPGIGIRTDQICLAVGNDRQFQSLCKVSGASDLTARP